MLTIGIIGAENSHAASVAKLINVDRALKGCAVTHLWGETAAFARATAEAGRIATVVARPEEMLGQVDGVMIDHRDGQLHLAAARPFVRAGVPVFVDKPICCSLPAARAFLRLRRAHGAPVCTMSSITYHEDLPALATRLGQLGRLRQVHLSGPGDWRSPWSGIWFYGIHQAELLVHLLGPGARTASATTNGTDCTAVVAYPDGLTATLQFLVDGPYEFRLHAVGHDGSLDAAMGHDPASLQRTTRIFTRMFRTRKEPFSDARMLAPIALMQAVAQSLQQGSPVRVPRT